MTVCVVLVCCIWLLMLRSTERIRKVMASCRRRSMMLILMLFIPCLQQLKIVFLARRCVRKTMLQVGWDGIAKVRVVVILRWLRLFRIVRWTERLTSEVAVRIRGCSRKVRQGMIITCTVGCTCVSSLIQTRHAYEVGARGAAAAWGVCHVLELTSVALLVMSREGEGVVYIVWGEPR
jgi:hypothetical protein